MIRFDFSPFDYVETDGSTFSTYLNGMLAHEAVSLFETPWNNEMAEVIKACKLRLKMERKKENDLIANSLEQFGVDTGKDYYPCRIDKRLIIEMKKRNLVITKFINLAIAEKLQRE
jgi:hypothetical protein